MTGNIKKNVFSGLYCTHTHTHTSTTNITTTTITTTTTTTITTAILSTQKLVS